MRLPGPDLQDCAKVDRSNTNIEVRNVGRRKHFAKPAESHNLNARILLAKWN